MMTTVHPIAPQHFVAPFHGFNLFQRVLPFAGRLPLKTGALRLPFGH